MTRDSLYHTGVFSDLTIHTTDQALEVHRIIVCSRSETFCRFFSDVPIVTPSKTQTLHYPQAQLTW
ncbi:MAG: BTB/POZ domain-containing protein [Kocuria palustris]|nr:BTB/POZ domain-containing protein [Kocuria palustris]